MKYFTFIAGLLAFLLSACGPQAAQTVNPAQVKASAAAEAGTVIALTQAAIPTDTPTPEPSPSPLPSPTLESIEIPTAIVTGTPQSVKIDCHHPLDTGEAGPTKQIVIKNQTSGRVNLSLTLYKPNAFGQCGSLLFTKLDANGSTTADLPEGYYSAYAWTAGFKVFGSFVVQPAQSGNRLQICIRNNNIQYRGSC